MPMVKTFAAIPRRKDISRQQFHDHWRHPHGTLSRKITTLRGYVQSHQVDCPMLGPDQTRYDGITELWYDSVHDATTMTNEPAYIRYNKPDEPLFVDMDGLIFVLMREEVIASRPDINDWPSEADIAWSPWDWAVSTKLIQLVHADADPAWASEEDADLGRRIGALRHVRSYPLAEVHGDAPPFTGVRELWWPTISAFEAGVAGNPEAFAALITRVPQSTTLLCAAERVI